MESTCFQAEKTSSSKNINYFDILAEIRDENSSSNLTTSNSSYAYPQDLCIHNAPKRSKSVSLDLVSRDHIKISRSLSENKAHDVRNRNDPQCRKLPVNISSRIGAVQVLPICNISQNVNKFCHKSQFDSGIISMDKFSKSEMTFDHKKSTIGLNATPDCGFNVSTSDNDRISALTSLDQDIQCLLNKKIHTLKPLENNKMENNALSESFQMENSVKNSTLTITSDHDIQSAVKRRKEVNASLAVNTDLTQFQNEETSIACSKNEKYLTNTVNNGPRITISREARYLLSNKNKVVPEPLYEEIEETEKQYKTVNQDHIFTSLNRDSDKEYFRRNCVDIRRQSVCDEVSKQQRFERLSSKDTNAFDEAFKIEVSQLKDEENDKNNEEIWIKYIDRPLLPLKTTLKQKSSSCTNLVQTFKVFSKRNSCDNSRSVDITSRHLKHATKTFNSEVDISKDSQIEVSQFKGIQPLRKRSIEESLETRNYTWYHQVDAREASRRLLDMEQDGVFLVRPASNPTRHILHTLCVTYKGCVYNMYIRHLPNGFLALGKSKENEKTFSSMLEMIQYHQSVPISINMVHCHIGAHVYLLITPPK